MASVASTSTNYEDLPTEDVSSPAPLLNMAADFSPIPKASAAQDQASAGHSAPVRSMVSRFEKKQEQSLDALPFRTVRSFFGDGDARSIHVTAEKQKYDALTEKQRAEAEARRLQRSPELIAARKRVFSNASPVQLEAASVPAAMAREEPSNQVEEEGPAVVRKLEMEFDDESNDVVEDQEDQVNAKLEETSVELVPPPPPPLEEEKVEKDERKQLVNTPEQETKKRPILTTERSFVMEEDHTIETEDLIVVGERFSTDGEEDREMLMEMLERELRMSPEDEAELREALDSNSSRARMLRRAYKYKRPENVPSKLFAPTAASLASRTTKSPSAVKREPKKATPTTQATPSANPMGAATPTRKSNKYANVQSKVKEMMKPTTPTRPSRRRESDASDVSHTSSRSSMGGSGLTPSKSSTKASQQNGAASVDRRSFMSNKSSRRSSVNRSLLDLHSEEAHLDWEGRHRSERLSFASSTSSTDSTDPLGLQLSYSKRKSRYDNVQPRYLDYGKQSETYTRNKEAQLERRRKLEETNAAKSADRQKQLQFHLKLKEKREKEDLEQAVRRGDELHKMTQLLKEKEKEDENERRKSQSAIRRALSGTGSVDGAASFMGRRGTPSSSSVGASSPRTSLLSEPDSIPSSATSGATTNTVIAA